MIHLLKEVYLCNEKTQRICVNTKGDERLYSIQHRFIIYDFLGKMNHRDLLKMIYVKATEDNLIVGEDDPRIQVYYYISGFY